MPSQFPLSYEYYQVNSSLKCSYTKSKRVLWIEPIYIRKHKLFCLPDVKISVKPVFCRPNASGNSIYLLHPFSQYSILHQYLLHKHLPIHFQHLLYSIHHNKLAHPHKGHSNHLYHSFFQIHSPKRTFYGMLLLK